VKRVNRVILVLPVLRYVKIVQRATTTTVIILVVLLAVLERMVTQHHNPLRPRLARIAQLADIHKQKVLVTKNCVFNATLANIPTK